MASAKARYVKLTKTSTFVFLVCTGTAKLFPLIWLNYDKSNQNSYTIVASCFKIIRSPALRNRVEEEIKNSYPRAQAEHRWITGAFISVIYKFLQPMIRPRFRHVNHHWLKKLEVIKAKVCVNSASQIKLSARKMAIVYVPKWIREAGSPLWLLNECKMRPWLKEAGVGEQLLKNYFHHKKCRSFVPGYYARWNNLYRANNPNYSTFAMKMRDAPSYMTIQISKVPPSRMSGNDNYVCTVWL